MKKKLSQLILLFCLIVIISASCKKKDQADQKCGATFCSTTPNKLRAPAYPLITIDPYTSAWSTTDQLYDSPVKHWTGKEFPLIGVIQVDDQLYRFMGTEELEYRAIVKTSEQMKWTGKYTNTKPKADWMKAEFNDSKWKVGEAAFGTKEFEPTTKTEWGSEYIWVRRKVLINEDLQGKSVYLNLSHDDDAIIYINGVEVANTGNAAKKNIVVKLSAEAVKSLKQGENTIAAYCYNRGGNAILDFGLSVEKETKKYFAQTAVQKSVDVQATQTHYVFTCGNVDLQLTFTAPLLMDNLELISRPVNYISYQVINNDQADHKVSLYFEASPQWAQDKAFQESQQNGFEKNGLVYLKTGTITQNILQKIGDDVRIDWGYFYMAAEKENTSYAIGDAAALRNQFASNTFNNTSTCEGKNNRFALVRVLDTKKNNSGKIMLGYDDIYSVQYFGTNLRPYWNADGNQTITSQFEKANVEYSSLMKKTSAFDNQLMKDAIQTGGSDYADLCALAYRQSLAAHKLVKSPNGDLLWLSKENFSNGSIGTVDITYPSAPLFLYYNPELAKGLLNFIFTYSESGKWAKPFPAHDIGTYPVANGQTYGGDMPVEEAGNMIIITNAIAVVEGNAKYAEKHWEVLTTWADYLAENGLDPENQLCTDDFAGHFAHNANLSIKAILGVASYGRLAEMLGKKEVAEKYIGKARKMATEWEKMANDGDHYKLTFDKKGTWSQKYNLVWDKLLKMEIFPDVIVSKEIPYYLSKQNTYGLPLDNRETYTKTDWIMWTATLSSDKATFEKFIAPIHRFMNETKDRVPMSDWVFTDEPNQRGFQARAVVGGYYIKLLEDKLNAKK